MSTIVVQEFVTLDGVVQAAGGAEEDNEGGFEHSGWASSYDAEFGDEADGEIVMDWESRTEAMLFGRKTYEIFAGSWGVWDESAPGMMGEFTTRYNRVPKYVASRTLSELGWKNSYLLGADIPGEVQKLRVQPGGEIRVWGSTQLITTLAKHDLIDEYRLIVYPLVLGSGKKLFADGFALSRFRLSESRALASGIVILRYSRGGLAG
jgi:dihydrofolate reductase